MTPLGSIRRGVRNVVRSRARSALAVAILALATAAFVATLATGRASEAQASRVEREAATLIQVNPRGALGGGPERGLSQRLVTMIDEVPDVVGVEAYLRRLFQDPSRPFVMSALAGVAPGAALRPMGLGGYLGVEPRLVAGRPLSPADADEAVAVVGRMFARQYGLRLADELVLPGRLLTAGSNGRAGDLRARVVGIVASGVVFPDNQVFIPLALAQRVLRRPGEVSNLWVRTRSAREVPAVERRLAEVLAGRGDILSVRKPAARVADSLEAVRGSSLLASLTAALAGMLVVFFTMALVARERRREVGVLKAIGASSSAVAAQFVAEAIALGFAGAALGLALGALGADRLAEAMVSTPGGLEERVLPSAAVALAGLVMATAAAVLGSLVAVAAAVRTRPAEAIRAL